LIAFFFPIIILKALGINVKQGIKKLSWIQLEEKAEIGIPM